MKATLHAGRRGSADHNDRRFDPRVTGDHHIDPDRMKDNIYSSYKNIQPFAEAEKEFYKDSYSEWINAQNKKHLASRNKKRCRTIDQLLAAQKTKPEEIILQIGNQKLHPDEQAFAACVSDFVRSLAPYAQNFHVIDVAVHNDEATPHAHIRGVWDYIDQDGLRKISQHEGLKQLGIELPYPDAPEGRYNNRKITYQKTIREIWYDICEEHGFQIERDPIPDNQMHLEKNELTLREQEKQIQDMVNRIRTLDAEIAMRQERLDQLEKEVQEKEERKKEKQKMIEKLLIQEK